MAVGGLVQRYYQIILKWLHYNLSYILKRLNAKDLLFSSLLSSSQTPGG
jgi:hypothetical protein